MGQLLLLASVCALLTGSDLSHSYYSYQSVQENPQECQHQEAWSPIVLDNFQGAYSTQCKLSPTGIGRSPARFFHCNLTRGKLISEFLIHNVHNCVFYKPFQCSNHSNVANFTNARSFSPVIDRGFLTSLLSLYNPTLTSTSTSILLERESRDSRESRLLDCHLLKDHSIELSFVCRKIRHESEISKISKKSRIFLDCKGKGNGLSTRVCIRAEKGGPFFKGGSPLQFKSHFPYSQFPGPISKIPDLFLLPF